MADAVRREPAGFHRVRPVAAEAVEKLQPFRHAGLKTAVFAGDEIRQGKMIVLPDINTGIVAGVECNSV